MFEDSVSKKSKMQRQTLEREGFLPELGKAGVINQSEFIANYNLQNRNIVESFVSRREIIKKNSPKIRA